MKFEINTEINIQAKPQQVWEVLMDFESYPNWNPLVTEISGNSEVGGKLVAQLPGMKFKPTVQSKVINKEFSWLGHLFVRGLFDGHHQFILKEQEDGSTLFIHKEDFNGLLVSLFKKKLINQFVAMFHEMNQALMKECYSRKSKKQ